MWAAVGFWIPQLLDELGERAGALRPACLLLPPLLPPPRPQYPLRPAGRPASPRRPRADSARPAAWPARVWRAGGLWACAGRVALVARQLHARRAVRDEPAHQGGAPQAGAQAGAGRRGAAGGREPRLARACAAARWGGALLVLGGGAAAALVEPLNPRPHPPTHPPTSTSAGGCRWWARTTPCSTAARRLQAATTSGRSPTGSTASRSGCTWCGTRWSLQASLWPGCGAGQGAAASPAGASLPAALQPL
jgi:hypothetical protein